MALVVGGRRYSDTMSTWNRQSVISALSECLEARPWVQAAWLGGSAAFGRDDEYSDIDLQCLTDPKRADELFEQVESLMSDRWGVAHRIVFPMPTWHGSPQRIYRLSEGGPFAVVDFVVMHPDRLREFLDPRRHGHGVVLFDRDHHLEVRPLADEELYGRAQKNFDELRERRAIFATLAEKEIRRGRFLDGLSYYHGITLRSLVNAVRSHHCPTRFDFGLRYLEFDVPDEIRERIEQLHTVRDLEDLAQKQREAVAWLEQLLEPSFEALHTIESFRVEASRD